MTARPVRYTISTRERTAIGHVGPDSCPSCLSARIVVVGDGAGANFLCEDCLRCWHETMGWLELIDPHSCIDCQRKPDCLTALAQRGH